MVVQDGDPLLARPLLYVYILLKNPSVDRKTKLFLWAVGSAFANKCFTHCPFFFYLKQANVWDEWANLRAGLGGIEKCQQCSRASRYRIFIGSALVHTLRLSCASVWGEPSWWHICFRHREAHSCLFSPLTSQMMLMLKQPDGLASFARNQKPRDPDSKWLKKWGKEVKIKKCTKWIGFQLLLLLLWLLAPNTLTESLFRSVFWFFVFYGIGFAWDVYCKLCKAGLKEDEHFH